MRDTIEQLREERDQEVERDEHEWKSHRESHARARDDPRRELGIPDPNLPSHEHDSPEHETEIATDRYGNEIIDMTCPVEPEPSREDPPQLEPDTCTPDRDYPVPDHYPDFEIGD